MIRITNYPCEKIGIAVKNIPIGETFTGSLLVRGVGSEEYRNKLWLLVYGKLICLNAPQPTNINSWNSNINSWNIDNPCTLSINDYCPVDIDIAIRKRNAD